MTEIETIQFEFVSRVKAVQARQEARAFPVSKAEFFSCLPPADLRQQRAWDYWCFNLATALAFEIAHEAHLAARQAKRRFKRLGRQGREANALVKQWCGEMGVPATK